MAIKNRALFFLLAILYSMCGCSSKNTVSSPEPADAAHTANLTEEGSVVINSDDTTDRSKKIRTNLKTLV